MRLQLVYVEPLLRLAILCRHPEVEDLLSESATDDTVFIIKSVGAPYVDTQRRLVCSIDDFDRFYPYVMEFFSKVSSGVRLNSAFTDLVKNLSR